MWLSLSHIIFFTAMIIWGVRGEPDPYLILIGILMLGWSLGCLTATYIIATPRNNSYTIVDNEVD